MAIDAFFDTNVLLYLLTAESTKARVSRELVASGGVISVQVLNEFTRVARRKHALEWDQIEEYLTGFRRALSVEPLTVAVQSRAVAIASAHQLGIFDANILAAAELAGCSIVYSEDMQDGFRLPSGPVVRNPFVVA